LWAHQFKIGKGRHCSSTDRGQYWYSEAPYKPTSRSGHTALLLPSLKGPASSFGLFVFGGRDSGDVEMCGQWPEAEVAADIRISGSSRLRDLIFAWCRFYEAPFM
jgi:hypothetical protein